MKFAKVENLTYLTADLPGIGGVLKRRAEDFIVEEVPLYEPCGQGEHLYLWVEKCKRLTTDLARFFAEHFEVSRRNIGFAGLKDKHAITRQMVSIQHGDPKKVETFDYHAVKILHASLHTNKLKRGHLLGNRFDIRLRDVEPTDVIKAKAIMDQLVKTGAPNYCGEQRFGYRQNNHLMGKYLVQKRWPEFLDELLGNPRDDHEVAHNKIPRNLYMQADYKGALAAWATVHRFERQAVGPLSRGASATQAINGIDPIQRSLLISALQSFMFNEVLEQRVIANTIDKIQVGDIAFKNTNRACFDVLDAEVEQPRCDSMEISPSGPMWGVKMKLAQGEIGEIELKALNDMDITKEDIAASEYKIDGARRSLRMVIKEDNVSGGVDEHGPYIRCQFMLPRGSFATVVMRELMKVDTWTYGHNANQDKSKEILPQKNTKDHKERK